MKREQIEEKYDEFFGTGYWEQQYKEHIVEFAFQCSNSGKPLVSGSLPLTIKGLDVEALANTLYDKWRVNYDDRHYMPRDLFTLAIQDIVRGGNDR